jgi:SAM-dependent methyltransferase
MTLRASRQSTIRRPDVTPVVKAKSLLIIDAIGKTLRMATCPVCGVRIPIMGIAPLRVGAGRIPVPLAWCGDCDLFIRQIQGEMMNKHAATAGYVWEANRERLLVRRRDFFTYLLKLAARHGPVRSLLDVGASYGHLLRIALDSGMHAAGVEVVPQLRDRVREELGVPCWADLMEAKGFYDLVAFVDSFYYFDDPHAAIAKSEQLLTGQGRILFRVTNRNLLIRVLRLLRLEGEYGQMGDVAVSWSLRGFRRLLAPHGMRVEDAKFYERGWRRPISRRVTTATLAAASTATARIWDTPISPGLIVIASRA